MNVLPIDPNIEKASTLPTSFYTDPEIFERSKEELFVRSWQLIGDDGVLKDHNTYPFKLLDGFIKEPLLLTRSEKGVRCLSNVCTHRGNLLMAKAGNNKHLVCGYHGRKFSLDGKFEFMPEFQQAKEFPSECDHLPQIALKTWNQFLFTSFSPNINFEDTLSDINERVGFLPIEDLRSQPDTSRDYEVKAHWALYCDNYLEGFHIPFVHHDLNEAVNYPDYETVILSHCNLQIGPAKGDTLAFDLPCGHIDYGKKIAAYYFWVFPNMMFNFYPWGLSINVVKPIAINHTRITYLTYVWDESKIENSAGELLDKVELEDEEVVESVQEGIYSRFYNKGRFSPTMEKGVHHFHQLLSNFLQ